MFEKKNRFVTLRVTASQKKMIEFVQEHDNYESFSECTRSLFLERMDKIKKERESQKKEGTP